MTTSTRRLLTTGLSLAAMLGLAMGVHALAEDPALADPPSAGASPAVREEFLLLTDGRLIQGTISREGSVYVVKKQIGVMRFPKKQVEGSYGSLQDAYRHKLAQLPEEDPAERLKLARWCLNNRLTAEAKGQLFKVLEISPEHLQAQAMLSKLELSEAARANRIDPAVQQTGAEAVSEDHPGARDSDVLRGAERGMRVSRLPVIFDLPRPLAIQRADEFARYIHPVLQVKCAKCHNAGYEGEFQLVPVTTIRQLTPDALRANLDATLRLVDPENPAKSDLLSSTLRPHGPGPRKRPVFEGSNNRAYQILAAWVNSLSPQSSRLDASVKAASARPDVDTERFASERSRPAGSSLEAVVSGLAPADGRDAKINALDSKLSPAFRFRPGQGMVAEDLMKADPAEFPLPYLLGGPEANPHEKVSSARDEAGRLENRREVHAESQVGAEGTAKTVKDDYENSTKARSDSTESGAVKKPIKPAQIDPAILEKLLKRNAGRTPEQ